jgi:hypothetical protein
MERGWRAKAQSRQGAEEDKRKDEKRRRFNDPLFLIADRRQPITHLVTVQPNAVFPKMTNDGMTNGGAGR